MIVALVINLRQAVNFQINKACKRCDDRKRSIASFWKTLSMAFGSTPRREISTIYFIATSKLLGRLTQFGKLFNSFSLLVLVAVHVSLHSQYNRGKTIRSILL